MDKLDSNSTNSTDFQADFDKNLSNNKFADDTTITQTQIATNKENLMVSSDKEVVTTTLDNTNSSNANSLDSQNNNTIIENIGQEVSTCKLDKKKDEKLKNLNFICIPFILTAIGLSLFNIGKVRYPLSFLYLAIGLLSLSISSFIRSKIISKTCYCKDCKHQSRVTLKFAFFYGFVAIGLIGVFIFYLVTGNNPTI